MNVGRLRLLDEQLTLPHSLPRHSGGYRVREGRRCCRLDGSRIFLNYRQFVLLFHYINKTFRTHPRFQRVRGLTWPSHYYLPFDLDSGNVLRPQLQPFASSKELVNAER